MRRVLTGWRLVVPAVAILGWPALAGHSRHAILLGVLFLSPLVVWVCLARTRRVGVPVGALILGLYSLAAATIGRAYAPGWPLGEVDADPFYGPVAAAVLVTGTIADRTVSAKRDTADVGHLWLRRVVGGASGAILVLPLLCCPCTELFTVPTAAPTREEREPLPSTLRRHRAHRA